MPEHPNLARNLLSERRRLINVNDYEVKAVYSNPMRRFILAMIFLLALTHAYMCPIRWRSYVWGWEENQLNAVCSHHQGRRKKKLKTLVLLTVRPDVLFKYQYLTGAATKQDSGIELYSLEKTFSCSNKSQSNGGLSMIVHFLRM